jgi:hypothetical protein
MGGPGCASSRAATLGVRMLLAALGPSAAALPTALPAGWRVLPKAICNGGIAPSAACTGHAAPGFSSGQAAWPFRKDGYDDATYAALSCTKSCAGCVAVTCGPAEQPAPQNVTAWCWARAENTDFCVVPGYTSYSKFPPPPPPPAPFRLPSIFADHMVLQRTTASGPSGAALWGHATPHASVGVTVRRTGESAALAQTADGAVVATANATADANGTWRARLSYAPGRVHALAEHALAISSSADENVLTLSDVLFGEVWLITGQSNAAFTVGEQAAGFGPLASNASAEIGNASASGDRIRLFNTGNDVSSGHTMQTELQQRPQLPWSRPSAAALGGASVMGNAAFSAVGWYYARALSAQLGVPVGMVMATYGGALTAAPVALEAPARDHVIQFLRFIGVTCAQPEGPRQNLET